MDIRHGSPTFLDWHAEILSEEKMHALYIPKGFAHGFQTLEDNCQLIYFHSEVYSPDFQNAIHYGEPKVPIKWPLPVTDVSERDRKHPFLTAQFEGIIV